VELAGPVPQQTHHRDHRFKNDQYSLVYVRFPFYRTNFASVAPTEFMG
jgi:hypothetical protein